MNRTSRHWRAARVAMLSQHTYEVASTAVGMKDDVRMWIQDTSSLSPTSGIMNHQTQTDEPSPGTWLLGGKTQYYEFPVNPPSQQPSGDGPARYRDKSTLSHTLSLKDRHALRGQLLLLRTGGSLRYSLPADTADVVVSADRWAF